VKYNILWLKVDFLIFGFFFKFKKKISVLEVEIGKNGPGILGVKKNILLAFIASSLKRLESWNSVTYCKLKTESIMSYILDAVVPMDCCMFG
jgi:hypothetical protein